MWYWILYLVLGVWALFDAKKRKNKFLAWGIGVLILGPIVLPVYFAKRNLRDKEVREGGTAWNVLKNFALFWTLTMLVVGIAGMVGAGSAVNSTTNDIEKAGAVIGTGLGMMMIAMIWFFPMIFALILGFFLKKSSIVEKGPTGGLSLQSEVAPVV